MKKHSWHGQTFWLHPDRLMYWEEQNILIGSDLHLGKTGHFRKAGLAMPAQVYKEDLQRLFAALQHFKPKQLLIVGDLFHSEANKEFDWFIRWRNDFHATDFSLVKGNHDILKDDWYGNNGIVVNKEWNIEGLKFLHAPEEPSINQALTEIIQPVISGHIHPGILVSGIGRQHLRLPCFYFGESQCILPAFSHFTGTYLLKPQKADSVFVITSANRIKGEQAAIIAM